MGMTNWFTNPVPAGATNDVDALIHQTTEHFSVKGFVLMNPDGIPVKYHEKMDYGQVLLYANLVSEFQLRVKRSFHQFFGKSEVSDLDSFRIRSKDRSEILVTTHNDFILVLIQDCSANLTKSTN